MAKEYIAKVQHPVAEILYNTIPERAEQKRKGAHKLQFYAGMS